MVKSVNCSRAKRAHSSFAGSQSFNGSDPPGPRNGKAPAANRGLSQTTMPRATATVAYSAHDQEQAQSLDLFGPPQEWSTAAEHWSLEQWQALNAILFNGNRDPHEFLLCHESPNAKERFNKAKRADLGWHVQQAYETIAGKAARQSGIGYYPWNGATDRESYWGGLDFDAHQGQSPERARVLVARLVDLLQVKCPTLAVIACTSGHSDGWHVFMFRTLPRPCSEWSAFLRKLAGEIGAIIGTSENGGDCELHPHETDERPRGIRAPGSLNPKDGSFGLVAYDSLTPRLSEWRELLPVSVPSQGSSPKKIIIPLGRLEVDEICSRYGIRSERTRHKRLIQMVGFAVNQCGESLALKAAAQLHKQARPAVKTPLTEHLADFARAWQDMIKKRVAELNGAERRACLALRTDTERSAFLIIRNWLKPKGGGYVHRNTLAARLEVDGSYAGRIRRQFCERGIMRMTEDYIIRKQARRYQWLLRN
jgi:hypothetical protein